MIVAVIPVIAVIKSIAVEFSIDPVDLPLTLMIQVVDQSLFFIPGHKKIPSYILYLVIILMIDVCYPLSHFSFHGEPAFITAVPAKEVIIFPVEPSFVIAFVKTILIVPLIIPLIVTLIVLLIVLLIIALIVALIVALITLPVIPGAGLCLGKG